MVEKRVRINRLKTVGFNRICMEKIRKFYLLTLKK